MNLRVIIIIISLLALFATAIGSHFSYVSLIKSTQGESHRDAEEDTEKIAATIESIITENQRSVKAMAGHDEFAKALVSRDSGILLEANNILDLFQRSLDVNVCYLIDSEGETVASSNRKEPTSFVGKNYAFRPYFQEAMRGKASVYMALGITSNLRGLYVGYPVYGNDKITPLGVAVIKTSVDMITASLSRSYEGIMTVTGPHGLIFISSDEGILYKFIQPVSEDTQKEITASRQFGKGPWDWAGIKIGAHDHGVYDNETEHHIHEKALSLYNGWKVVYLHKHGAAATRISDPIFRTGRAVIIIFLLIMAVSIVMLYKKASDEIIARKELESKLRKSSITDELTGLYNRRGFFELARHEYHTATRNKDLMSLFYMDIDDMKMINDKYGHKEGDNALIDLAEILKTAFRKSDVVARIGGDEFSALMIRTTDYKSENISNRIENMISDHNRTGKRPFKLGVSIGEVVYDPEKPMDLDTFINTADALMYKKKKNNG